MLIFSKYFTHSVSYEKCYAMSTRYVWQEVTRNTVTVWRTGEAWSPLVLAQDNTSLVWPDTLGLDQEGFLWATTRAWPIDSQPRIVNIYTGDNKPFDHC